MCSEVHKRFSICGSVMYHRLRIYAQRLIFSFIVQPGIGGVWPRDMGPTLHGESIIRFVKEFLSASIRCSILKKLTKELEETPAILN